MKAFIDDGETSTVDDGEFCTVKQMSAVLDPVKVTSDASSRDDATLITAEGALKFIIKAK